MADGAGSGESAHPRKSPEGTTSHRVPGHEGDPELDREVAQWAKVRAVFDQVAELSEPHRSDRLRRLCDGDEGLINEVRALLGHDETPAASLRSGSNTALRALFHHGDHSDADSTPVPEQVGKFKIIRLLGEGGMGIVYLAEQPHPRRTVALKLMRPGFAGRQLLKRFQREAELLGRLQHPNIALIFEADQTSLGGAFGTQSLPYFVMEYVDGVPIGDYAHSNGLSTRAKLELFIKVCEAVDYAHHRGIIHRDLKPANILVTKRGEPKVLDFGIARRSGPDVSAATMQTEIGQVIGTLPYMSPEQVAGRGVVDARSDVYALGVILYELLAKRRPHDLADVALPEAVRRITETDPVPLRLIDARLRGDLDTIVGKCLEKEPSRRYSSAAMLAEDLRRHLSDHPIEARPQTTLYQLRKFTRRHRAASIVTAVSFVVLLAISIVSIILAITAYNARVAADAQLEQARIQAKRSTQSFLLLQNILTTADPARSKGRDITVRELLDEARADLEKETGEEPEVVAMLLRAVGYTYSKLGDLESAEILLRRSLDLHAKAGDAAVGGDGYIRETEEDLGLVLDQRGKLDEAAFFLNDALERERRSPSVDTLRVAVAMNNLGLMHQTLGHADEAIRLFKESLALRAARPDAARLVVDMAKVLVNIGATMGLVGRYAEAEPYLRKGLADFREQLGPDDPLVFTALSNLAMSVKGMGNYEEADRLLRETLAGRRRILPPNHYETAVSAAAVAQMALQMGRVEEAERLALEAIEIRKMSLGEGHADTFRAMAVLGQIRLWEGKFEDAESLMRQVVENHRATLGPAHFRLTDEFATLAEAQLLRGDAKGARESIDAALAVAGPALGPNHPVTIACRVLSGRIESALGDDDAALRDLQAAAVDALHSLGADHPERAEALLALACIRLHATAHDADPRPAAAIAAADAEEAGRILRAALPSAPWRSAVADAVRGAALMQGGDAAEGRRLWTTGRKAVEDAVGASSLHVHRLDALPAGKRM